MIRAAIPAVLVLPLLAACAKDDPDNIPLRGQWHAVTEVDSVTIDGQIFALDMLPPEFAELQKEESVCGEPVFTNRFREELALDWHANGSCDFETWEVDGARITATGRCEAVGGIEGFNPRFDVELVQRTESYRFVVNMAGSMSVPGQGQHHARFIAVQEGNRTGDC